MGKKLPFLPQISSKMGTFSTRNTNIYKIRKLYRAIFSVFYNVPPPNFAILLIQDPLFSCFKKFHSCCQVRPLLYLLCKLSIITFRQQSILNSIFQLKFSIIKSMVHNITLLTNQTLKVPEQTVSEKLNSQALKYMQIQVFCVLLCYTISRTTK